MHQDTPRSMLTNLIASAIIAALIFFPVAGILMAAWNYTVPRLIKSVDSSYTYEGTGEGTSDWTNIDYVTSMAFVVLLLVLLAAPFAIFREWRVSRLMGAVDNKVSASSHRSSGATIESMRAKRAATRRSLGSTL